MAERLLYILITIANATAASAAASTMTISPKIWPSRFIPPKREKAIKFKFAAFKINSTPINTAIPLRLVITPKTPREKRIAAMKR